MNDVLTEITAAEAQAEEIVNNAKKRASTIIESSKTEIQKRKKEIYNSAEKLVETAIEEKKLLAQFESEKIKEESENIVNSLKEKAANNMDKAVSFILSNL